jgi:hypothetical protein
MVYAYGVALRRELRHLRAMGLIESRPGKTIGQIVENGSYRIADYVTLTGRGRTWLTLRRQTESTAAGEK